MHSGNAVSLGKNASGEICNQLPGEAPDTVAVFCGSWEQPAARIRTVGDAATPMQVATSSPWRDTIELRFICDAPVATSILGDMPAALMHCRRRIGGWPQVALVASSGNRIYQADGILPTLAVIGARDRRAVRADRRADRGTAAIGCRPAHRIATCGARIQLPATLANISG